jgi:hypothetical protein
MLLILVKLAIILACLAAAPWLIGRSRAPT